MLVFLLSAPSPVGCPAVTPFTFALFWPLSLAVFLSPLVVLSVHAQTIPYPILFDSLSNSFNIHPLHAVQNTQPEFPPFSHVSTYNPCVPLLGSIALDQQGYKN